MTPAQRTPQQRDRRFARVRHVTQVIFLGSCAASALFVGYAANAAQGHRRPLPDLDSHDDQRRDDHRARRRRR